MAKEYQTVVLAALLHVPKKNQPRGGIKTIPLSEIALRPWGYLNIERNNGS